jgi:hypothetical protein
MSSSLPTIQPLRAPRTEEDLFAGIEAAHAITVRWLHGPEGRDAMQYLTEARGLPTEILVREGVGCVPASADGNAIAAQAAAEGIDLDLLVDCGILDPDHRAARHEFRRVNGRWAVDSNELTAFFRTHLTGQPAFYRDFPYFESRDGGGERDNHVVLPVRVRDERGKVRVASWIRRTLMPNPVSRYINSRNLTRLAPGGAEVPFYESSGVVVGLPGHEDALDRVGEAAIVEGMMDRYALMAALREHYGDGAPPVLTMAGSTVAAGVREGAYAPLAGRRVTLFPDNDKAGLEQMGQNVNLLGSIGCVVGVGTADIALDGAAESPKDLNELLVSHGTRGVHEAWRRARSQGPVTFLLARYAADYRANPQRMRKLRSRLGVAHACLFHFPTLPESVRGAALADLARALDLDIEVLRSHIPEGEAQGRSSQPGVATRR